MVRPSRVTCHEPARPRPDISCRPKSFVNPRDGLHAKRTLAQAHRIRAFRPYNLEGKLAMFHAWHSPGTSDKYSSYATHLEWLEVSSKHGTNP